MKFRVWILGAALLMALTTCGGGKSAATPSPAEETQTVQQSIHGTINQLGDYLILLEDKGEEYRIFDFGEGVFYCVDSIVISKVQFSCLIGLF